MSGAAAKEHKMSSQTIFLPRMTSEPAIPMGVRMGNAFFSSPLPDAIRQPARWPAARNNSSISLSAT